MAITDFPDTQYYAMIKGPVKLGKIELTADTKLGNIICWLTKIGVSAGTERFRINIYSESTYESVRASSDWVNISELENHVDGTEWYGYITFDFDRIHIGSGTGDWNGVYADLEMDGYTSPVDDSYYWAVALDWPEAINTTPAADEAGAAMTILGYRE